MEAIIYKTINPNGEIYIGSTTRKLSSRKAEHKYRLKQGCRNIFYNSLSLFGFTNHLFIEVCKVSKKDMFELEHFIIETFNPKLNTVVNYNATSTGKIWVNDGVLEFQIYPDSFNDYSHYCKKGRIFKKTSKK